MNRFDMCWLDGSKYWCSLEVGVIKDDRLCVKTLFYVVLGRVNGLPEGNLTMLNLSKNQTRS